MADQYGLFWNSVSGDRTYDADSFSEWLGKFFTTGVFNGDLQVTPDSGMVVNVGSGYANINGKVRFFDTDTSITISPASGVYPRIDTIVVRADYTNREITLEYVTGSYSGNDPQPTAPTRNASMYEIVLAQILVSAGSTEVTTGSITDTRPDSTVCGWVTGTVDSVAVDQLTAQAQAQFEVWFEHMKGQLSEDAAGNLQLQIDALDTRIDGIDTAIGDTDISTIGDGTVTGAVSALNNGLLHLDKLWENPSPTASYSAQTVSLDLSGYDFVLVGAYFPPLTELPTAYTLCHIGGTGLIYLNVNSRHLRFFEASTTGVHFEVGQSSSSPSANVAPNNATAVPSVIYGVVI